MSSYTDANVQWWAEYKFKDEYMPLEGISASTAKLEISSSAFSLFSYGEWVFSANAALIEDGNILIGTNIRFHFLCMNGEEVVTLSVLGFTDGPGAASSSLQPTISLVLVSPWYMEQQIASKAYKGSASDIITQVLKEVSYTYSSINIAKSYDNEAIRYRTLQNESQFLKDRVRPYSKGSDRTSNYLFCDHLDNFVYTDYKAIKEQMPCVAIDPSHPHIAAFRSWAEDLNLSKRMLYLQGAILQVNTKSNNKLWNLAETSVLFNYPTGYTKGLTDKSSIDSFGFDSKKIFAPLLVERGNKKLTHVYVDRSLQSHPDVINKATNQYNKELLESQIIEFIGYSNIHMVPGTKLLWYIIKPDSDDLSLYSQEYIITEVSHLFQGTRAYSYITAATTGYVYKEINKVQSFFNIDKS